MRSTCVFVSVLLLLMIPIGCGAGSTTIVYILPDDFQGEARIYTRSPDGVQMRKRVTHTQWCFPMMASRKLLAMVRSEAGIVLLLSTGLG